LLHNNSLLAIVCAALFVTYLSFIQLTGAISAHAQTNITGGSDVSTPPASSVNATVPIEGFNLIVYTKSGGFAPSNELYAFNALSKELVFLDLTNNTVKKRALTEDEITTINNAYAISVPDKNVYDTNPCPDCIQYSLLYSYFDGTGEISDLSFWTDATQDTTERLTAIGKVLEDLTGNQMTNTNTTLSGTE
jgi:hypothetical protein